MTKAEAQAFYRSAWQWRCFARTDKERRMAGEMMDSVQARCTDAGRPGTEWDAFAATLPGYLASWAELAKIWMKRF